MKTVVANMAIGAAIMAAILLTLHSQGCGQEEYDHRGDSVIAAKITANILEEQKKVLAAQVAIDEKGIKALTPIIKSYETNYYYANIPAIGSASAADSILRARAGGVK